MRAYLFRLALLYRLASSHPFLPKRKEKPPAIFSQAALESGDDLSSRAVTSQVLLALRRLTSVFGMGTGGTFSPLSPETLSTFRTLKTSYWTAPVNLKIS